MPKTHSNAINKIKIYLEKQKILNFIEENLFNDKLFDNFETVDFDKLFLYFYFNYE